MLSRVADALYWTGRYLERVENTSRSVSVNFYLTLDLPASVGHWEPLLNATGDRGLFESCYGTLTGENVVRFMTYETMNPNSILSSVNVARSNANSIRDFITLEMWEQLNGLYLKTHDAARVNDASQQLFKGLIRSCQLISGIADTTMSHDEGWHFFRVGRMIERADKTSRMLEARYLFSMPADPTVMRPYSDILWAALLRSSSALQMYRKRYHQIVPERVIAFLVLDRDFPRSIRHCTTEAEEAVRAISKTPDSTFHNRAEQVLGRLRAYLDYMNLDEIMAMGVGEFSDTLQLKLNEASDAILQTFCAAMEPATDDDLAGVEASRTE